MHEGKTVIDGNEQLDSALNEALGFFEALRRMGFPAEEIFLGSDPWKVFISLVSQGKRFDCVCGEYFGPEQPLHEAWQKKAVWWTETSSAAEREAIWEKSFAFRHAAEFVTKLVLAGFVLPIATDTIARA